MGTQQQNNLEVGSEPPPPQLPQTRSMEAQGRAQPASLALLNFSYEDAAPETDLARQRPIDKAFPT